MKYMARVTSYMEDGCGGYDHNSKWITKGKIYDLKPDCSTDTSNKSPLMSFVDDAEDKHYVPVKNIDDFFVKL